MDGSGIIASDPNLHHIFTLVNLYIIQHQPYCFVDVTIWCRQTKKKERGVFWSCFDKQNAPIYTLAGQRLVGCSVTYAAKALKCANLSGM